VNAPDILVLLCDTARADAFHPWGGPARSPTMGRLCHEGTMYELAVSPAPWTLPAVSSIFSGCLPTEHRITAEQVKPKRPLAERPPVRFEAGSAGWRQGENAVEAYGRTWLPESLRARGYRCWGISCNPWIGRWDGFDRGFDRWVDIRPRRRKVKSQLSWAARRVGDVAGLRDHGGKDAFLRVAGWIHEPPHAPWFTFVNMMELHDPYDPPPRFHPLVGSGSLQIPLRRSFRTLAHQVRQRSLRTRSHAGYLETIRSLYYSSGRYQDWLVGRFVQAIVARGRPTVIFVVSDHGENLGEHGLFEHHSSLHETLLHVPLAAWGHKVDVGSGRVADPVSLLGLPAWIERVADGDHRPIEPGGAIISEYESTVERPRVNRREFRRALHEQDTSSIPALYFHPGMSVRDGGLKYVFVDNGEEAVYDLVADPSEERNILHLQSPETMASFRRHRDEWRDRRMGTRPLPESSEVASPQEGEEIEEHLRMLGYIE
jgi:arylsulfatase A-like enzyme